VASSAIHASGNRSQRDKCASVAESTRSFFSLASAMAFTRAGCTSTIFSTSPERVFWNAGQKLHASITTCAGPGKLRAHRRNSPASLPTARCCRIFPLASITVT
jgi:hypothetical protein